MTDFTGFNYKNLVMNFKNTILEHKKTWFPNGLDCIDKETFLKDNKIQNAESIFAQLDFDNDGYITEREFNHIKKMDIDQDGLISEEENAQNKELAYQEALFFARRNIDKWFTIDIDRDGHWSNVEEYLARFRMACDDPAREHQLDASMTNQELAEKYGMVENLDNEMETLSGWMNSWADYVKENTQAGWGVELTDAEMINIKKEMIKQLNTWLFKTGDNATHNAPLYQSLCSDSYTRLETNKQTVSCCGGNIIPPPASEDKGICEPVFMAMEYTPENQLKAEEEIRELENNLKLGNITMTQEEHNEAVNQIIKNNEPYNTAEEVQNRLAWAIYPEPARAREIQEQIIIEKQEVENKVARGEMTQEEADEMDWSIWSRMSDEEYAQYHEQYMNIRNMTAADYRELLKPENEEARLAFEENSNMTVRQIVQYIDIVESVTGKDFDSDDWQINSSQFMEISVRVNDTQDDSGLLQGKTRADIPENRQNLLRFLEEKGWLYDQFKF